MGKHYYSKNGLAAQYQYCYTEAIAAEGRCKGRMSDEAYAAAVAKMDEVYGYPTPEQRRDYWYGVEAGLMDDGAAQAHDEATATAPRKRLYDIARETVEQRQSWPAGQPLTIWTNGTHSAYIRSLSRTLVLGLRNGSAQAEELTVSKLDLACGPFWPWKLDEADYEAWASKARAIVKG